MKYIMQPQTLARAQFDHIATMNAVFLLLLTFSLLMLMTSTAYAYTDTWMGSALCHIWFIVYGNVGRGLATLAVAVIGVGATLGKTSWGLAMTVAVGIAVVFNAPSVVGYLGSGAGGCSAGDAW